MKNTHQSARTILPGLLFATAPAFGAVTYIDATSGIGGNTRESGQAQSDASWHVGDASATNDSQWAERANGSNSNIFQALPNDDPGSIPPLTTTISGLTNGQTYKIYAFFQDNVGDTSAPIQNWVLAAGLSPTLTTTFWSDSQPLAAHNAAPPVVGATGSGSISATGVIAASDLSFVGTAPDLTQGSGTGERRLYAVDLGNVTLSGTEIEVYVDMLIEGSSSTTRTWYDGVGFEAIPEPSSTFLLGLGGLALAARRRR